MSRDPFSVEKFVAQPRFGTDNWIGCLDVPKATIPDARRWLRAQGYHWTVNSRWRIVDRNRRVIKEFIPKP